MANIFLKILNMSISASWVVLTVLVCRILLRKAPKWIAVLLWGIVALRLVCPFSIESVVSLLPSGETVSSQIMLDTEPAIHSDIPSLNSVVNPVIEQSFTPDPAASINPLQIWIPIVTVIWVIGIACMLTYGIISYLRIKSKIRTAVLLRDNIYQSENVASAFVLGMIKPKIYMPFHQNEQAIKHVIAHETAHVQRKDHWWKPLGFLVLTLHWFNPAVWLGYVLLCRDIELACDQRVVKNLNDAQKADYSQALLTCSINRRMLVVCPLAFGEIGVKNRVKSVLYYKKPAFWIVATAIAASIVVGVCFLTDPVTKDETISQPQDQVPIETNEPEKFTWINLMGMDSAVFDIDGDGKEEQCALRPGPTSGLFTFILLAYEDGKLEYFNIYNGIYGELSFVTTAKGTKLHLLPQLESEPIIYSFHVKDGNIVLTSDDQTVEYWGEQGIHSPYAPKMDFAAIHYPVNLGVYEVTPVEEIQTKYDNEEFVIQKLHYQTLDQMWFCEGYSYQYRLEITGRMHHAAKNSTYIVLSNTQDITFDQTWKASGLSSSMSDYFDPQDAVIVGHKLFD